MEDILDEEARELINGTQPMVPCRRIRYRWSGRPETPEGDKTESVETVKS